jgi:hypothetical protein
MPRPTADRSDAGVVAAVHGQVRQRDVGQGYQQQRVVTIVSAPVGGAGSAPGQTGDGEHQQSASGMISTKVRSEPVSR